MDWLRKVIHDPWTERSVIVWPLIVMQRFGPILTARPLIIAVSDLPAAAERFFRDGWNIFDMTVVDRAGAGHRGLLRAAGAARPAPAAHVAGQRWAV